MHHQYIVNLSSTRRGLLLNIIGLTAGLSLYAQTPSEGAQASTQIETDAQIVMNNARESEEPTLETIEQQIQQNLLNCLAQKQNNILQLIQEDKATKRVYRQQIEEVNAIQDNSPKLIHEIAKQLFDTDYSQLDYFHRQIYDYILQGNLTKADSLLCSKGDIKQRIENFTQFNDQTRNNLAADCYTYFEMCKMKCELDSAEYFIKSRADLDPLNVGWSVEAAEYLSEYMGEYSDALRRYLKALDSYLATNNNEAVAHLYYDIASAYYELANYDVAINYLNKALTLNTELYGENSKEVGNTYNYIGLLYAGKEEYDKALKAFSTAQKIMQPFAVTDQIEVARTHTNIGLVYCNQGKFDHALKSMKKALEIYLQTGKENVDLATLYQNICNIYCEKGKYAEAIAYGHKALKIQTRILWPFNGNLGATYLTLAGIYKQVGDPETALKYFTPVLEPMSLLLDNNDQQLLDFYRDLGETYQSLGQFQEALIYFNKALGNN